MIEKGMIDIGGLNIRLYIDPTEPEYLQFTIYECEEKQTEISDEMANMILEQPLHKVYE